MQTYFSCQTSASTCYQGEQITAITEKTVNYSSIIQEENKENLFELSKIDIRMLKVFLNKSNSVLTETKNVTIFKNSLDDFLQGFGQIVKNLPTRQAIIALQHDLKNQNLMEISSKYFKNNNLGGLTNELAPYLGEKSNLKDLSLHEAQLLRDKLISDFVFKATNRDGLMSFFIHHKRDKNTDFNCHVIDVNDLSLCLVKMKEACISRDQKINLMVRTEVHYTAVILESKGGNMRAAVMDAAGDKSYTSIVLEIENAGCIEIYVLGAKDLIQFDKFNCAFFSFDSIWQAYKRPDFFECLKELPQAIEGNSHLIAWKDMPAGFVRNATSLTFMKNYHANNPLKEAPYKNDIKFEDYVNNSIEPRNVNGIMRNAHTVLENRVMKQKPKIESMIEKLTDEELIGKINQNLGQALIRSL